MSDAERIVAKELRARGRYVSGDAGAVVRALAENPTRVMIEAGRGVWDATRHVPMTDREVVTAIFAAMLRAETREEQPLSDAERIVGEAITSFLYRHCDLPLQREAAEAVIRALIVNATPTMIEAGMRESGMRSHEAFRVAVAAFLSAETHGEQP